MIKDQSIPWPGEDEFENDRWGEFGRRQDAAVKALKHDGYVSAHFLSMRHGVDANKLRKMATDSSLNLDAVRLDISGTIKWYYRWTQIEELLKAQAIPARPGR